MPESLSFIRRLLAPLAVAITALAVMAGAPSMPAQTPLCTLTFGQPVEPAILNDDARGCLNRAAAEYRSHPGSHIAVRGSIAARVSAARQYLLSSDLIPVAAILDSTAAGNALLVQVTVEVPEQVQPGHPPPPRHDRTYSGSPSIGAPAPVQPTPIPPSPVLAQSPHPPAIPAPAPVSVLVPTSGPAQPGPGTTPPVADPYAGGERVEEWENNLKSGNIDFNNPKTMVVGQSTGIVVVIHGYQDPTHSDVPGVVEQGTLKISDYMRVDLTAPLAPGEFQITPTKGAVLPVPLNGSTKWEFQVTPLNETSDPQTLMIQPYLIRSSKSAAQPLPDRTFTVQVTVEGFWHHIHELWEDDPIKVAKYFLPGGQGWSGIGAFLTGLIALLTSLGIIAWIKRKIDARGNPKKRSSDSP